MIDIKTSLVLKTTALELMKSLPDKCAGAIIIDPPARFGASGTQNDQTLSDMAASFSGIAEQVHRVLKSGGACLMMGEPQTISAWELSASWAGLKLISEMVVLWASNNRVSKNSSLTTSIRWHIRPGYRYITRPKSALIVKSNVIVCQRLRPEDRIHVTQRPAELYNYLISLLTNEDDLIVDPFCGTGSALVAAEMCGRPWIGSDILATQRAIALRRVKQIELEDSYLQPLYLWTGNDLVEIKG